MTHHKPDPNRAAFGSPAFVGLLLMSDDDEERQQLGYNLLATSLLLVAAEDLRRNGKAFWTGTPEAETRRATQQHQRA